MAARLKNTPDIDFSDVSKHTGYHIRRAHTYFSRAFIEFGRRFDLRSQQATILSLTEKNPGITPARIADANDIKRTLVAKLTTDLKKRGLIKSRTSDIDRRQTGLHLTAKGRKFLHHVMATFAKELDPELTRNLTAAEKKTLIRLLKKVYQD